MRWSMLGGRSLRAYHNREPSEAGFCISTRSAELQFLLSGELWIEFGPAEQQLRVLPGEGCVVYKGTPHKTYLAADSRLVVIDIDPFMLGSMGATHVPAALLSPALERYLETAWQEPRPLISAIFEASICDLLVRVRVGSIMSFECSHTTRRALEVKAFLDRNYRSNVSLEELAKRHAMGRFYLLRSFKENVGATPLAYVRYLRLEHYIWSMLRNPSQEHIVAAMDAGVGDYSTFSRKIRSSFGVAPSGLFDTSS